MTARQRKETSEQQPQEQTFLDTLAEQTTPQVRERYEAQKAEGIINPIVLAQLMRVRPQMIYNYLGKGKFTEVEGAVGTNTTQKKVLKLDEANTWAKGYFERKVARETKAEEKAKAELNGEPVTA